MTHIQVVHPGLGCSIQDDGRTGYARYGVPRAGGLDMRTLNAANLLAKNPANTACLEVCGMAPVLRIIKGKTLVAVTGFKRARVTGANGSQRCIDDFTAVRLSEGDLLEAGPPGHNVGYVSFAGGLAIDPKLGACSAFPFGDDPYGFLHQRQRVTLGQADKEAGDAEFKSAKSSLFAPRAVLRVLPGSQAEYFDARATKNFYGSEFILTSNINRMGARLKGPPIVAAEATRRMVSEGVVPGCIQISPDGAPTLLLADCQTLGGYPKIAVICSADLPAAGRLKTGDVVRFQTVTRQEAMEALKQDNIAWERWRASIGRLPAESIVDVQALYNSDNLIGGVYIE